MWFALSSDVPMPHRRYAVLLTGKAGVVYALEAPPVAPSYSEIGPPNLTVHRFDLSKRKSDVLIVGVKSFQPSFNGEKMLYQQGDRRKANISEIVYLTSATGAG